MKIVTEYVFPPIPIRAFDWCAPMNAISALLSGRSESLQNGSQIQNASGLPILAIAPPVFKAAEF